MCTPYAGNLKNDGDKFHFQFDTLTIQIAFLNRGTYKICKDNKHYHIAVMFLLYGGLFSSLNQINCHKPAHREK